VLWQILQVLLRLLLRLLFVSLFYDFDVEKVWDGKSEVIGNEEGGSVLICELMSIE